MTTEKASFYSRDLDRFVRDKSDPKKTRYIGMERRRSNRRRAQDRRGDVRFDLNKSDRRQTQGRRAEDITPKFF
jgi:hypothetical protein